MNIWSVSERNLHELQYNRTAEDAVGQEHANTEDIVPAKRVFDQTYVWKNYEYHHARIILNFQKFVSNTNLDIQANVLFFCVVNIKKKPMQFETI